MQQSFFSATSGLNTHQSGVDSWANNISNINTNAYKTKIPEFTTLFNEYLSLASSGANTSTQGFGTTLATNKTDFTEGVISGSENPYDLAITKKGFFVLNDNGKTSYTRDGAFTKNADGYLVSNAGKALQGVDLGKIDGEIFVSDRTKDNALSTQNVTSLSSIKIPAYLEYRSGATDYVDMSLNLNPTDNLTNIQDTYDYVNSLYADGSFSPTDEDASVFYDLKQGDSLSMSVEGGKSHTYLYGTDFTTLSQLQSKVLRDQGDFVLSYASGAPSLTNISSDDIEVSFANSSQSVKDAFGLSDSTVLSPDASYQMQSITSKNELDINFNALYSDNVRLNIKKGDNIIVSVDNKHYNMYYGKANETVVNGAVIGESDTFLTLGDFTRKMKAKSGVDISLYDDRLSFAPTDSSISFDSSNKQLLSTLGLGGDFSSSNSLAIVSNQFKVATYSSSTESFDESGTKYFINTKYVLKNRENLGIDQAQTWDTNSYLVDKNNKASSTTTYNAILSFDDQNAPPTVYTNENGTLTEADNINIQLDNTSTVAYNIAGNKDGNYTTNQISTLSQVTSKDLNGNAFGVLEDVLIDEQGLIKLQFSNNKQETMGRVALVDFINPQGLQETSNNEYSLTYKRDANNNVVVSSGNPKLLWDDNGRSASNILSNSLERSNVNLSTGLTELIVLQRAYSANSKVVTTSDEMEQQAINLKGG